MFSEISDFDLLEEKADREARQDLWRYRQRINPNLIKGWFPRSLCWHIQEFYTALKAGEAPIYILCTPPQHGKSSTVADAISWIAGQDPSLKTIFASYSERLGIRANLRLQRIFDSDRYQQLFPETHLPSLMRGNYRRNNNLLEYLDQDGYFRNTTVGGPITGEALDLGIIDDPIKGRSEAQSQAIRDKTWDWLMDDVFSRFSEKAGLLMINTRWHLDDPTGRLQERHENVRVIRYPALAEPGAALMEDDPREAGSMAPLFSGLKSKAFLLRRKAERIESSWQSIYQQNPIISGGDLFPIERFTLLEAIPDETQIASTIRYWDKGGTEGGGDYSAGVKMHEMKDGRFIISDVVHQQLGALDREKRIKQTAQLDGRRTKIWVEQEPGSGGKESAERTIRLLSGFNVHAERVTGDKETRAEGYAAQVQAGNVYLLLSHWNKVFLDEHENFPNGLHDDQVDAASGAFNKLTLDKTKVAWGKIGSAR